MKNKERLAAYRRNVALFVSAILLILSFMIIRPFLVAILSAAVLSYIFYPLYCFLVRNIPAGKYSRTVSALLTCSIVILIVLLPVLLISNVLLTEIKNGYGLYQEFANSPQWSSERLSPLMGKFAFLLPQIKGAVSGTIGQIFGILQDYVVGIPNLALQIVVMIFTSYYFLKHGSDLYKYFSELVPLTGARYRQILLRFDELSRGMIMGQVFVGIIQGVLAWLGFNLLGVPNSILWGSLTAIVSIVPLLGAAIIWVPVAIYLALMGTLTGEYWKAVTLFFYGALVISTIDNILKPKIIGGRAKVHPLLILFGILGGIRLFGIPGLLIGPIILALFDVVIEIYKESL